MFEDDKIEELAMFLGYEMTREDNVTNFVGMELEWEESKVTIRQTKNVAIHEHPERLRRQPGIEQGFLLEQQVIAQSCAKTYGRRHTNIFLRKSTHSRPFD